MEQRSSSKNETHDLRPSSVGDYGLAQESDWPRDITKYKVPSIDTLEGELVGFVSENANSKPAAVVRPAGI